jgi:hypothetical protein
VIALYTRRTGPLLLGACIAALVGLVIDEPLLAAAGFFTQALVILWAVRLAKRRPDLLAEAEEA